MIENNTLVEYDNGILKGDGVVIGLATTEMPIIGIGYIVQDVSGNVPNEVYQYSSFVVHTIHLKVKEIK